MTYASTLLLLGSALAGCVETKDGITGVQSLEVAVTVPSNLGTFQDRLPDTERDLMLNMTARSADNNIDATFTKELRVYANFLGTLTPELHEQPLTTFMMVNGVANNQTVRLPDTVFGPTTLWIDDGEGVGPDYQHGKITGTSSTIWFRDPYIVDLQRPRDETALDALSTTPLQDKQINVNQSRYGENGRLVVTSVFSQGYTVSDVQCGPGGAPPCTSQAYDHVLVFTFSAARDQFGNQLVEGSLIESFVGGLTEFNGLTELGFPRTFVPKKPDPANPDFDIPAFPPNPALLPPPVRFDPSWFGGLSDPAGRINFEKNEAGAIEVVNGIVCPTDEVYDTYKQWKIDPTGEGGANCDGREVLNVITAGTSFTTDPRTLVGKVLPRVVGIVRPVSIGSFNVWIIYPRGESDITLP